MRRRAPIDFQGKRFLVGVRGQASVGQKPQPPLLVVEPAEAIGLLQDGFRAVRLDALAGQEAPYDLPEQLEGELEPLDRTVDGERRVLRDPPRLAETVQRAGEMIAAGARAEQPDPFDRRVRGEAPGKLQDQLATRGIGGQERCSSSVTAPESEG